VWRLGRSWRSTLGVIVRLHVCTRQQRRERGSYSNHRADRQHYHILHSRGRLRFRRSCSSTGLAHLPAMIERSRTTVRRQPQLKPRSTALHNHMDSTFYSTAQVTTSRSLIGCAAAHQAKNHSELERATRGLAKDQPRTLQCAFVCHYPRAAGR
jgi:hypothetical protein